MSLRGFSGDPEASANGLLDQLQHVAPLPWSYESGIGWDADGRPLDTLDHIDPYRSQIIREFTIYAANCFLRH